MKCPLKPGITCAGTPRLASEGRCLGCTAGRARTRSLALGELPLNEYFVILRQQLRDRLETENARLRGQGKVKGKSQDFFSASGSEPSQGLRVKGTSQGLDFAGVAP